MSCCTVPFSAEHLDPEPIPYGAAHAADRRGSGGHCSAVHCRTG